MTAVTDMIVETEKILIEIRKCINLYYYCNDSKIIYNHILRDLFSLKKLELLSDFSLDYFNEDSSLEVLKLELIKLYKILTNRFLKIIDSYQDWKCLIC